MLGVHNDAKADAPEHLYRRLCVEVPPGADDKLQPPQAAPVWDHTPERVAAEVESAISSARAAYDKIAALPKADRTFASVFGAWAAAEAELLNRAERLSFYQHVSSDGKLRDASTAAEGAIKDFDIEREMRIDLFEAAKDAAASAGPGALTGEDKRLADKILLQGRRAGLDLPESERKELEVLKKELSAQCIQFLRNYGTENGQISFSSKELEGVPGDVLSGYKTLDDGKLELSYKQPDLMPLLRYARNPATRRAAWTGDESRVAINVPIFEKVVELRRKIAALLKYPTYADYVTEVKMVKTGQAVVDFVADVEAKVRLIGELDKKALLDLKKEQEPDSDGNFYIWDWFYYNRLSIERKLDLDANLVKEYFPVDVVVPSILKIYQDLLGVEFVQLSSDVEKGDVWHPEVQRYAVWNAGATDASGFLGYAYLDLYPRENKFPHAAVWALVPGYDLPDGTRSHPVTAMVANVSKSTPDRSALMTHQAVTTFFHEMGHLFHNLLSRAKYARFDGTAVSNDFVEAPSKMLENWCWEPSVLKKMSSHYETKEPLSDELIDKIVKSRFMNIGLTTLRQLAHAKFDIVVHTQQGTHSLPNLESTHPHLKTALVMGPDPPAPGHTAFPHLMGGYEAGYYGYTYALVFATDMFSTVFAEDPLSPVAGKKYREEILRPGGSRDEMDSLTAFLGRPPNAEAFLRQLLGSDKPASI
ncbi:zincin [Auricularia subglabra TFB-10046 SS5]|uniref:Zincin n=1 Tax=Auricularia subglabra (strain TFB-10046 / SS5) TaxID=717982 RepID=J0CW95_AURST|nr:zincin [Auricularia subglabra TFB-10046 SS5]